MRRLVEVEAIGLDFRRVSVNDISLFFFFQAEDGIRDYKVTGVQTCALPICIGTGRVARAEADGYTLILGTVATHVFNAAAYTLKYDVAKDFDPVSLIAFDPQIGRASCRERV